MTPLKLAITRGFIKLALVEGDKVVQEGGFEENWETGRLWVLVDVEKNEVVDGSFTPHEILKKALKYAKEKAKGEK